MSFFIDLKRKDAMDKVINNLKEWASLLKYGVPNTEDFIPSISTSLIQVTKDQPNSKELGSKVIEAIVRGDEYREFIYRYTGIVNALPEVEREAIENKYLKGFTYNEMRYGSSLVVGNDSIKKHLDRAYHNIALIDETISYSVNDYLTWKNSYYGKENAKARLKEKAYIYLSQLNKKNKIPDDKKTNMQEIRECLDLIPEIQRAALLNYIEEENKLTSYEYRKVKFAICCFMYIHKDFDYDIEEFKKDMSVAGNGWKKCFNHVVREVRLAKEKELEKEKKEGMKDENEKE